MAKAGIFHVTALSGEVYYSVHAVRSRARTCACLATLAIAVGTAAAALLASLLVLDSHGERLILADNVVLEVNTNTVMIGIIAVAAGLSSAFYLTLAYFELIRIKTEPI